MKLLDNTNNQTPKYRTKNWVEINDDGHGVYGIGDLIKFETTMSKSSLCDYIHAYIIGIADIMKIFKVLEDFSLLIKGAIRAGEANYC